MKKENWKDRIDEVINAAKTMTRSEAASSLGTTNDNFRHICKRYNIDIRERKPYATRSISISKKDKSNIERTNDLIMMRW
ncbi:MAG: hypothetical protein E2O86_04075 [Bacteroidetes bacterium]|nr:MAG: hypothetical protein E2O86_04075 [Bacteroidota bacterium]